MGDVCLKSVPARLERNAGRVFCSRTVICSSEGLELARFCTKDEVKNVPFEGDTLSGRGGAHLTFLIGGNSDVSLLKGVSGALLKT